MSQHTPGPWTWSETPEGQLILEGPPPYHDSLLCEDVDFTVRDANARLIAAAPEMLFFLREYADHSESSKNLGLMEKANALLARIEGKQ